MIKKINFFLCLLFFVFTASANSSQHPIRLAVFDNPKPDPSSNENTQQFVNSYLAGINTAITVAAGKGIYIAEKEFFHENNLSNIIQQASNTKAWLPDVIVGLSTSNDFLMSRAFFGDQIILSISATDSALAGLPKGFYSLGIPDTDAVNAIIKFVLNHYPNSNLFIISSAESKESVDFGDLLAKKFKLKEKDKLVHQRKFLTDDMDNLPLAKLMADYHKNDVIVIMSIGYDSAIQLMNKISSYLDPVKSVFVTSTDNWGNNLSPQKMSGNYDAFRIDTLSGGEDTEEYKIFLQNFKKIYHSPPKDKISFVTYQTVMSFVEALIRYPTKNTYQSFKKNIFSSYMQALTINPNWYRPPSYDVYKLENQKEIYIEKIS